MERTAVVAGLSGLPRRCEFGDVFGMYPGIVLVDPSATNGTTGITLRAMSLASGSRNEAWLRDFLLAHPEALPTAAIDPAYADPIAVCRELRTPAGPLDCLFVTRFGGLVAVECKLWRNPQARREVVGQILDYAEEIAAWGYADLQREVSVARGERGTNALFDLVAARHPETNEAAFVDAVARNLARGRLMLLLAGDGIREGTESIVQYVGRYAGLHLTFGLVEVVGYEMPDGRFLVQPRVLARTVNLERAVVRVDGPGAAQANVLTPEEAVGSDTAADPAAETESEGAPRRSFDPVVLEADRRWREDFTRRLRLDDPAQDLGRTGFGRVFFTLPVPWAWMTAFTSRRQNLCGNTLVLKGGAGRAIFEALEAERDTIDGELKAGGPDLSIGWRRQGDLYWVEAVQMFPGTWSVEQEPAQLEWLLTATNVFVNAFRPRVLRLLSGGSVSSRLD